MFAVVAVLAGATAYLLWGLGEPGSERRADRPAAPAADFAKPAAVKSPEADQAKGGAPGSVAPAREVAAPWRLRVRVVHADGGPAAGASVEVYENSWAFPLGTTPAAVTTTELDGTAALSVVPGSWVRAARGDAASMPAQVVAGGAVLVLEPARRLRGIVLLPEGAPASGYGVSLSFLHAERVAQFGGGTDERGSFELALMPDAWIDRLVAKVYPPEMKPSGPREWEFEFGRDQLRSDLLRLQLTVVRLHARVVGEDGAPVAHAMVHWAPSAPGAPSFDFCATTDEDGRFEVALQRIAGETFLIRAPGYAPLVWKSEGPHADRKVQIPEIVLRRGVPLFGRVTDPAGRPEAGAAVRLESARMPGQVIDERMTDAEGVFRFDAVGEEDLTLYSFRQVDPDLSLPQLRMAGVRGGQDELRVVLPEPILGAVRFVAQGTGDPLEVEHLTLIVKDARGVEVAKRNWPPGLTFGAVRFEVWEEGTYRIEVYTAHQEPAVVSGVTVVRGRGPEVSVPLVPRR